jgi:hypothetical protein
MKRPRIITSIIKASSNVTKVNQRARKLIVNRVESSKFNTQKYMHTIGA